MGRVLVNYASNHGHTGRIAERLGSMLTAQDLSVTVHEVEKNDSLDCSEFDAVVVLASIHADRHQAKMAKWVRSQAGEPNGRPTAFLSVSLSSASGLPEVLDQNLERAQEFADEAGWKPNRIDLLAGCLQYPAYSFLTRFLMKRLAKRQGLPLDTSVEHEYTDWEQLERFAREFAEESRSGVSPTSPA